MVPHCLLLLLEQLHPPLVGHLLLLLLLLLLARLQLVDLLRRERGERRVAGLHSGIVGRDLLRRHRHPAARLLRLHVLLLLNLCASLGLRLLLGMHRRLLLHLLLHYCC